MLNQSLIVAYGSICPLLSIWPNKFYVIYNPVMIVYEMNSHKSWLKHFWDLKYVFLRFKN